MRRLALAVLPLLLAGCVDAGLALGSDSADGSRAPPSDVVDLAREAATAWNPGAVLIAVRGGARDDAAPGIFTFGAPGTEVRIDGTSESWQYAFAVPGTVALFGADVTADGKVSTRGLDLSFVAPSTQGYEEYFAMTPVEDAWLAVGDLVAAIEANATTRPWTEGEIESVEYELVPDVRTGYAWRTKIVKDGAWAKIDVDPETWTLLSFEAREGDATSAWGRKDDRVRPPSGLAVRDAYGERNGTDAGVWRLRFDLDLSGAAQPFALSDLVVVYRHGEDERRYALAGPLAFEAEDEGGDGRLDAGERARLAFTLEDHELRPREKASVHFETPHGRPVDLALEMPLTFANAHVVRLA